MAALFKCNVCNETCENEMALKNHRRRAHNKQELLDARNKIKTHKCDHCNRGYHSKDALRVHQYRCSSRSKIKINEVQEEEIISQTSSEKESPKNKKLTAEFIKESAQRTK